MRLVVNGKINADACNAFGIYILEKNLPEEYRQRLYNKLLALCEKEAHGLTRYWNNGILDYSRPFTIIEE